MSRSNYEDREFEGEIKETEELDLFKGEVFTVSGGKKEKKSNSFHTSPGGERIRIAEAIRVQEWGEK